jgi:hypothetical protein
VSFFGGPVVKGPEVEGAADEVREAGSASAARLRITTSGRHNPRPEL